ncbi:hypothetical protein ONZ45_g1424 [Pleurotus djamor]|nr:hypothetical protein ONZ45_g1424 [Pleurotus djamor]
MDSREELQRISIDSVVDWNRVKDDYRTASMAILEEQIKSQGLSSQRDALIAHLNQFVDRTFAIAKPNLRVNGRNFEEVEPDDDVEPFDEALDRHIWSLADNRLNWHTKLAEARRTKPKAIEAALEELLALQAERDATAPPPIPNDDPMSDDLIQDENIQNTAVETTAIGHELSQTIPSQYERSERSKVVAAEIKMIKP